MRHFINYVRVRVPETAPEVKRESPASTSSDSLGSLQVSVKERKKKERLYVMLGWIYCLDHPAISKTKINMTVDNYCLLFPLIYLSNFCLTYLFPLICQNSRRPKVLQREVDVYDMCIN